MRGFAQLEGTDQLREITARAGRHSAQKRHGDKMGTIRHTSYYTKCDSKKCHCQYDSIRHVPHFIAYKYYKGKTYIVSAGKEEPVDWAPYDEKLLQKIIQQEQNA